MSGIFSYLKDILLYVPSSLAVIIIFRILRLRKLNERGIISPLKREILLTALLLCILALLSQTIFKDLDTFMREGHLNINLKLFDFIIYSSSPDYFLINVLGNVIFFIPLGLFVPLLWNGPGFLTGVGSGFLCSLMIEICQLPLLRATDVDDLLLNTLGALAGYLLYLLGVKAIPKLKTAFRVIKN